MADKDKDEDLFKRFALLQSSSSGTKPSTTPALSEGLDELWFRLHKLKGTVIQDNCTKLRVRSAEAVALHRLPSYSFPLSPYNSEA